MLSLRSIVFLSLILPSVVASTPGPHGHEHLVPRSTFDGTPWPAGIVPYRFAAGISAAQQAGVLDAMAEIEGVSGVNFVPWTAQVNFITVRPSPSLTCPASCSFSALGMTGGEQFVDIGSSHWFTRFIIVHELFHTLGFRHEHQRPDRNTYITVNVANISQTLCNGPCDGAFAIRANATTYGGYDFASIMHYGQSNFSNGNGNTIDPKPAYAAMASLMGNSSNMTVTDALGLQAVYGLPAAPTITNITPDFMVLGTTPPTITITGARFYDGSTNNQGVQGTRARWNGAPLALTYVSPTQVQIAVTNNMVAAAGAGCVTIEVENYAVPGGGTSNTVMFNIIDLTPTVDRWRGNTPSENSGFAVAGVRDVNGDGHDDVVIGAPGFFSNDGRVTCYSGATGATLWNFTGPSDSALGTAVAAIGDVDGDGIDDVAAGAPAYSGGQGRVYVLRGNDGSLIRTHTGAAGDGQGRAVASAGDYNGDGIPDLIVGGGTASGLAGVVRVYSESNGAILATFNGAVAGEQFGVAVGGGVDVNLDGVPDVVIGAPFSDANGSNSGRIEIRAGGTGALLATRSGSGADDQLGISVAMIRTSGSGGFVVAGAIEPGDLFGAGVGPGYVRVFGSSVLAYAVVTTLPGNAVGDRFGGCVRSAGDLDQDGSDEFIIGAWQGGTPAGPTGAGFVRVVDIEGFVTVFETAGAASGDRFGFAVASGGDLDGDGRWDVLVGAPNNDATCPAAGEVRAFHPPVPPARGRVLITEVSWDNPDGVEVTNFGSSSVSLNGWRLEWDDGAVTLKQAVLSGTLSGGASLIVVEIGGNFAGRPAAVTQLAAFPAIGTTTQDFTVRLVRPNGVVTDSVRIADAGGVHAIPSKGDLFRGLALRSVGAVGVERIWELDSNAGADWTAETQTSMGRENRSSGPRGTDPVPSTTVLITEVDDNPDFVEIRNQSGSSLDLWNWYFLASAQNSPTAAPTLLLPWPDSTAIAANARMVIGDAAPAPTELPAFVEFRSLAAVGGGNLPFTTSEFELGLYDSHGRLVDLVRTVAEAGPVVHNTPRVPSAWSDFVGGAPRTLLGDRCIGRVSTTDADAGSDWRAVATRSMGLPNPAGGFTGASGHADAFDVRAHTTAFPGFTIIMNAGTVRAGDTYYFLVSGGHQSGLGPVLGLGADALTNFQAFGTTPPFTGVLDGRGSARIDFDAVFPAGLDFDAIFALVSNAGVITAQTLVLEFDS